MTVLAAASTASDTQLIIAAIVAIAASRQSPP
jgi:hypothetical protein